LGKEIETYYKRLSVSTSTNDTRSTSESRSRSSVTSERSDEEADNDSAYHYCGATVITDKFLVTAAHCFAGLSIDTIQMPNLAIGVGAIRVKDMQKHKIARIHLHPNADQSTHYNDIALIELNEPLQFSDSVRPVCLPFVGHSSFGVKDGGTVDRLSAEPERPLLPLSRLASGRRRTVPRRAAPVRSPPTSGATESKLQQLTQQLLITEGAEVQIAGLGDTQFGGKRAEVLQNAHLVLIDRQRCDSAYRRLNSSGLTDGINEQFVCATDHRFVKHFLTRSKKILDSKRKRRQIEVETGDKPISDHNPKVVVFDPFPGRAPNFFKTLSVAPPTDKEPADACQGDSGGPLIALLNPYSVNKSVQYLASSSNDSATIKEHLYQMKKQIELDSNQLSDLDLEGRMYLIGVVALGRRCSDADFPGVYVNVNYHKRWILSTITAQL
jgi:hypothetical protein